jgi:hypothetical protein
LPKADRHLTSEILRIMSNPRSVVFDPRNSKIVTVVVEP